VITIRRFNHDGLSRLTSCLAEQSPHAAVKALLFDNSLTEAVDGTQIDENQRFDSRYSFGKYLCNAMSKIPLDEALNASNDSMWAWINALFFQQLAPKKTRRSEHYICIRKGSAGSLLHRNASRTAFELVAIHGDNAKFTLQQPMHTHGQLLESLSASQGIVRNKSFFSAAAKMYLDETGKIKRGATSKPKEPRLRKPGEVSGKGSIRRLPLALRRLDLTYDVHILSPDDLIARLPREYERWTRST